jgi:hypothetical protein
MKKQTVSTLLAVVCLLTIAMFSLTPAAKAASKYSVRDGKVFYKNQEVAEAGGGYMMSSFYCFAVFLGPAVSPLVPEKDRGMYFFNSDGKNIFYLPYEDEGMRIPFFSPEGDFLLLFSQTPDGGGVEHLLFTLPDRTPTAAFSNISDEPYWVSANKFVYSRVEHWVDDDSEMKRALTSLMLYDAAKGEKTVLKQADATHTYFEPVHDEDKWTIKECRVKEVADWKESDKIHCRPQEFTIDGPTRTVDFQPGQTIVARENTAVYESLDDAEKNEKAWDVSVPVVCATRRDVNEVFTVREDMGDWLRVGQGESGGDIWVKAAHMMPLDAFMADPANREIIECSQDLPRLFVVDLAPDLKQATIRITAVPSIDGGYGVLEVLTPDKSKVLWSSQDQAEGDGGLDLYCAPNALTWPEIIGDINGDGFAELLYMRLRSSASIPEGASTIFTWDGKAFVASPVEPVLAVKGPEMPSRAAISDISDYAGLDTPYFFVSSLINLDSDGTITANFFLIDSEEKQGTGKFTLTDGYKTFTFKGWLSPPEKP